MGEYPHRYLSAMEEPVNGWEVDLQPLREEARRAAPVPVWLRFAAVVVITTGVCNAIEGLVCLFDSDFYLVRPNDILAFGMTGWGWVHLVVGSLVALTGVGLLAGFAPARPLTVVFATVNAVAQLVFVAVYPVWSLVVIALSFVVIWAVIVHGEEH